MAAKSDALRERYRRFSEDDLEGAVDLWSDDFVWEGANASEIPGSGRHEGKWAAIEVVPHKAGTWDKFELSADELVEQGDTVVVLGHILTWQRASGPSVFRSSTSGTPRPSCEKPSYALSREDARRPSRTAANVFSRALRGASRPWR